MKKILFLVALFLPTFLLGAIKVAVTVDDLPTHGHLPPEVTREGIARKMLAALKKHRVPEVYAFLNAGKVEVRKESFEVLQLWKEAGFPFGNHTYLHPDLNETPIQEFENQISKNEPMLKQVSGNHNWKFFRFPHLHEGDTMEKRTEIRKFLIHNGYTTAQVTIDFEDWSWNDPYARCKQKKQTDSIAWLEKTYLQNATDMLVRANQLARALFKRSISHILLLHIGAFDAEMLDKLLTQYEQMGVEFIGLTEATQDAIYSVDPGLAEKAGSEFTYQVLNSRHLKLRDVGMEKYMGYPDTALEKICLN